MSSEMITLLVPTMNRSDFLIRLICYYRSVGFEGYICIGDSSNAEHLEPAKQAVEFLKGELNIIYREYPGLKNADCLKLLIDITPTPYAAFIADDDYLVPDSLEKCCHFLDGHPDYNSAHGCGVAITLEPDGVYGEIASVSPYRQPVIEAETATRRLIEHLSRYAVTLFSVHRKESWQKMYEDAPLMSDIRFTELLPSCLSAIQGKEKELDCFYLVRQSHLRRYLLPGKTEWMARPDYPVSYKVFHDGLARALAEQDELSLVEAGRVVEHAFSLFLSKSLLVPWQARFGVPHLLQVAAVIPGSRQVWRASRRLLHLLHLLSNDEIPVEELLSSSSPYYADFLPVYRSLSGAVD